MVTEISARRERVIWLERLASRCKQHAYTAQARALRRCADRLNQTLPEDERVDIGADECRAPVETPTLRDFLELVDREINWCGAGDDRLVPLTTEDVVGLDELLDGVVYDKEDALDDDF